ncbi:hypothetical protein FM106_22145 [Brachybacterium faecium]|nr:hypothetical protein FM106_22145 [Brachybacterium faecium]
MWYTKKDTLLIFSLLFKHSLSYLNSQQYHTKKSPFIPKHPFQTNTFLRINFLFLYTVVTVAYIYT